MIYGEEKSRRLGRDILEGAVVGLQGEISIKIL